MIELIDEIGIDYAETNGGGLPLTAKEYCNALALWIQQKLDNGGIAPFELLSILKGSDSIKLTKDNQEIEISISEELLRAIESSLKLPATVPTETELVGVNNSGQQVMVPLSSISVQEPKKYAHKISCDDYAEFNNGNGHRITFTFISNDAERYTTGTFPWGKVIYGTSIFVEDYTGDSTEEYNAIITINYAMNNTGIIRDVHIVSHKGQEILYIASGSALSDTVTEL